MGSFLLNNNSYAVKAENQLSILISNFDSNYIFGVVSNVMDANDEVFDPLERSNAVNSFESNFIAVLNDYPEDKENIMSVREECYSTILQLISSRFKFQYNYLDSDIDLFPIARLMYEFFVSSYHKYILHFLAQLISSEKESIYNGLNLANVESRNDISTLSNKSIISDDKMGLIIANLETVMNYILGYDFSLEQILGIVYNQNEVIMNVFLSHILPIEDFYQQFYQRLILKPNIFPVVCTNLKFELFRRFSDKKIRF